MGKKYVLNLYLITSIQTIQKVFFLNFFKIEVQLFFVILIVSGVLHSNSISLLIILHLKSLYNTDYIVPVL